MMFVDMKMLGGARHKKRITKNVTIFLNYNNEKQFIVDQPSTITAEKNIAGTISMGKATSSSVTKSM